MKGDKNPEGLTFEEWFHAACGGTPIAKAPKTLYDAWANGEAPAEYRLDAKALQEDYCLDCGAMLPHHCQGVPGGFGDDAT